MKKWLLGSLIGAIILFLCQFLSWTVVGIHDKEFKHVNNQDQVLATLSAALPEDGQYMLPSPAPGASNEEKEKLMKDMAGKPYVIINYTAAMDLNMIMPMIRGFIVDLVLVLLAIYVIGGRANLSLRSAWTTALAIGLIAWLWYPYTAHIWLMASKDSITGALIDWFIAYSLLGLWLGYWLRRV